MHMWRPLNKILLLLAHLRSAVVHREGAPAPGAYSAPETSRAGTTPAAGLAPKIGRNEQVLRGGGNAVWPLRVAGGADRTGLPVSWIHDMDAVN